MFIIEVSFKIVVTQLFFSNCLLVVEIQCKAGQTKMITLQAVGIKWFNHMFQCLNFPIVTFSNFCFHLDIPVITEKIM